MQDHHPEQWRKFVDTQLDHLGLRMHELESRIESTTAQIQAIDTNTSEVVAILRDWKGAMNVLKFTSKFLAPIGVIATAVSAVIAAWVHK